MNVQVQRTLRTALSLASPQYWLRERLPTVMMSHRFTFEFPLVFVDRGNCAVSPGAALAPAIVASNAMPVWARKLAREH
jgi:hypothetical protein